MNEEQLNALSPEQLLQLFGTFTPEQREQNFNKLSVTNRKGLQTKLQGKGLYPADARVDGIWGPATGASFELQATRQAEKEAEARNAEAREREDALEQQRLEIQKMQAQSGAKQADAEAERIAAETEAKKLYDEQSSSDLGLATSIGANVGAPLAGVAVGRGMGAGINWGMDQSQKRKNVRLAEAAEDRLKGVTTRKGAMAGTRLAGAMPSNSSVLRVGGRMLPHAITGGGMAIKGGAMLSQGNEDDPFYTQMANRGAGLGMIGTGVGIAERGANYAVTPGVPPDARSIAIIESEGLRRNNTAPPEPKGPTPGTLAALKQEARDLQIPGRSKLTTKGALQTAIENARKGTKALPKSGILAPLAAGGLAYSATRNPAEAGQEGGSRAEAATNAALAGGTAAGTVALAKRYAPRVLGALSRMSGPLALAEGAGEIQKRLNQPGATAGGVASEMYDEAFGQALNDFMALMRSEGPDQSAGPYTP